MVEIIEATEGKTRDKPINDKLRAVLTGAADVATIETVLVTSGGQAPKGSGGKRTGSTRHDNGNAADLKLLKGGRPLDFTKPADRSVVEAFVSAAAALGSTGIGAGVDYMGAETLHVGFGKRAIWGAGGKGANAPGWLKAAVAAGWEAAGDSEALEMLLGSPVLPDERQIGFVGRRVPLADGDLDLVAGYLGCELAALRAVLEVESRAAAFASDGRPIILNEPHVFFRELSAGAKRNKAVAEGLAYKDWGTKPYPEKQAQRYAWLEKAMVIDEAAALKSCSWGMGQIMGFNHGICGFNTVQDFVEAMTESEGAQVFAMARFIVSKRIDDDLRARQWSGFARTYNGAKFAEHGYHTKLKAAYEARPASERVVPAHVTESALRAALVDNVTGGTPPPPASPSTPTPTEPAPPLVSGPAGSGDRRFVIARGGLNVRAGHSTAFEVLRALPFGTFVHVLATHDDWVQIDLEGDGAADGFVLSSFLRPASEWTPPATGGGGDAHRPIDLADEIKDVLSTLSGLLGRLGR